MDPGRRMPERDEDRIAMQVLAVAFIESVLSSMAPVAGTVGDADSDRAVLVQQFARHVPFDRRRRRFAVVDPNQPGPLLDGIDHDSGAAAHRRLGAIGERRHDEPALQVKRPAVIAAGEGAGEFLLADGETDAAVLASVLERAGPALVAEEHDLLAEQRHRFRLATELGRAHHGVPVVPEAQHGRVVVRIARYASLEAGHLPLCVRHRRSTPLRPVMRVRHRPATGRRYRWRYARGIWSAPPCRPIPRRPPRTYSRK